MGGLYDILESYREKDNRLFYDGLYEDPDRFLDYDNSRQESLRKSYGSEAEYPFTGNIPTNPRARFDARRYNRDQVLPSSYGMNDGTFFNNFNPRIGLENQIPKNLEFLNNQNQADSITEFSNSILEDLPKIDPFVGNDMEMNNKLDPRNFQSIFPTSGIMKQAPTQNYQFQTSAYEDQGGDVEQEFLPDQKSSLKDSLSGMGKKFGLSSLLGLITGNPILGLIGRGAEGLGALNDRMQNSDFGQSRTGADFFKLIRDRKALARDPNVFKDARDMTSTIQRDAGRNDRPDRNINSVTLSSAAKSKGVGGGGYTKADSDRENYRGR